MATEVTPFDPSSFRADTCRFLGGCSRDILRVCLNDPINDSKAMEEIRTKNKIVREMALHMLSKMEEEGIDNLICRTCWKRFVSSDFTATICPVCQTATICPVCQHKALTS